MPRSRPRLTKRDQTTAGDNDGCQISRDQRSSLCQRAASPGPSGRGLPPGGHICPLPPDARRGCHLCVRNGRARRSHNHYRREAGPDSPRSGGRVPRNDTQGVRGVRHLLRQLLQDVASDSSRVCAESVPGPPRQGSDRRTDHESALLSEMLQVPPGSLRERHVPEMRRSRRARRPLRVLRKLARGSRARRADLQHLRRDSVATGHHALVPQAGRLQ